MGIETKTLGQLIDELSITNIKCYMAQEPGPTRNLEKAQSLNKRRAQLVEAIDKVMGKAKDSADEKSY